MSRSRIVARVALFVSAAILLSAPLGLAEEESAPGESELPKSAPADLDAMVLVPAGPAQMGYDHGKGFERPQHTVVLDAFLIDLYAVTNFQYRRFVRATGCDAPPHWLGGDYERGRDLHPVTNVRWEDAAAYARWAGKRLPTEAEWEKAARGTDGRIYPYGNKFDLSITNNGSNAAFGTMRVDSYPTNRSPYGCFGMAGNVWEWVSDWFSTKYYAEGQVNPQGPPAGTMHVSKGGSWTTDAGACRASFRCRSLPGARWGYCGFRCARSATPAEELKPPGREDMALVPEGFFLMGTDHDALAAPQRKIWLDAYLIDRTPVTHAEYDRFCRATGTLPPPHWHAGRPPLGREQHPVNNVTLDEARAYAKWAGKALPTEAQWEKAARGTDGRLYPWGEDYDETRCNTRLSKVGNTVPVGTYPEGASPYGVLGMCGNIWEWVEGRWDPRWYAEMPERNPNGAQAGGRHVLKGGTWSTLPALCRTYARSQALPGARWGYCGFRCVAPVPAPETPVDDAAGR